MNKVFSFLIALVITALALVYALWDVDFQELSQLLSGGKYSVLAPFTVALILFYWFKALRWAVILRPLGRFSWIQVTPAMMIGFGGNNILPAHLGELIRTVVFSRHYYQPMSSIFTSLILERILDVIAILVIYLFAVLAIGKPPEALQTGAWIIAGVMCVVTFGILILLLRPSFIMTLWSKSTGWLSITLQLHGRKMLENAVLALSSLKSPWRLTLLIGYSILQWGIMSVMVWLSLQAFDAFIPPSVTIIVLTVISLAVTVPSAPGYVGAIQAAFVFALVPFGVKQEIAFAASVFFLVAQWIPVTTVGALCFIFTGLRVADVRQDVEKAESVRDVA
ncbi:MAG: lysylphosphatidylglycerol synthase transmembrane domain-containing protein [Pseudomonadota bacterium]